MKKEKQTHSHYSEEFKWQVVQEILSGRMTKEEARRVYNVKGKSDILYWIRQFSGIKNYKLAGSKTLTDHAEIFQMKELSKKDKRIKELEEELKREKLRADLWQKIVELAEDQLNIDIRKKYGAKPSTPSKKEWGEK